jgi:hypothetical protein
MPTLGSRPLGARAVAAASIRQGGGEGPRRRLPHGSRGLLAARSGGGVAGGRARGVGRRRPPGRATRVTRLGLIVLFCSPMPIPILKPQCIRQNAALLEYLTGTWKKDCWRAQLAQASILDGAQCWWAQLPPASRDGTVIAGDIRHPPTQMVPFVLAGDIARHHCALHQLLVRVTKQ